MAMGRVTVFSDFSKIGALLLTTLCLSFCFPLQAADDVDVRIGYIEFPPVFSTNAQGKAVGSLIDLTTNVLDAAKLSWSAHSYPTKRMINHIVEGRIDLWVGLTTIPAFEGTTLIGKQKLASITLQSFSLGNKPAIVRKEDLSGRSVIILRGYSYGGWINYIMHSDSKVHFVQVDSHREALNALKHGRAEYLLDYQGPVEAALQNFEIKGLNSQTISSFDASFVVSAKTQGAAELLQRLEHTYLSLKNEALGNTK